MRELEGKVALVTGGGRGIGLGIVEHLAALGADLVINDLDAEPARQAVATAQKADVRAVSCVGNIARRDFADKFIDESLAEFGKIDIVVNNAGYATYGPVVETSDEDFEAVVDVLVNAPFRILRAAGRYFQDAAAGTPAGQAPPSRKVVNIASIGGIIGAPNQVAYAVGKAGVIGLTNTLAFEWGSINVNVNAVAPGLTRTRLTEGPDIGINSINIDGKVHQLSGVSNPQSRRPLNDLAPMVALKRIGAPSDIAGAVGFLCSSNSDFITGQTLVVDGGMRIGR